MNKQSFEIFHWEFFIDDDVINVYEKRSGDVIGWIKNITIPGPILNQLLTIEEMFVKEHYNEEQVYNWIEEHIEYI